jgi:hypothetical protein
MSSWFHRAAGSVGVVGAVLLLGAGTAPAPVSVPANRPQLRGLFADLLKPTGDLNDQGLSEASMGSSLAQDLVAQVPDSLRDSIDGPNMIGDDFVDQSPYAAPLPLGPLGWRSPN